VVVNTTWLALQLNSVHPGLVDVMFDVFTVEQSTLSFQLMMTLLFIATPIAPSAGFDVLTVGAVLSMVTVLPAPADSVLLDESVALLLIV